MRIALMGDGNFGPFLNLEGSSGVAYQFKWNKDRGQYEYEPKTREQLDDIFAAPQINPAYFFKPVFDLPSETEIAAFTATSTQCKERGIPVQDGDAAGVLYRLLNAYNRGANAPKALSDQPAKPKESLQIAAEVEAPRVTKPKAMKYNGILAHA